MARMKKSKFSKENETDRLSDLPDGLIHHILSFMDTKNAVQTSVLSKRWVHLWTCLPTLVFDCHSLRSLTSFKRFVLRVLSRREPSDLHTLKFRSISSDKSFTARVFRYAAWYFVQEVHMDCAKNPAYGLFSITTLRTLHLDYCSLSGDHFASCVNLGNLIMNRCFISGKVIKVSAPRLVTLKMSWVTRNNGVHESESESESESEIYAYTLEVSSPRLSSFCYQGICPSLFSMEGCPLLDSVDFRVHLEKQAVLPFLILQELTIHAKLLTTELKQGFTVKTLSRNDDGMHAVIYNEATKKRRKLFWRETDENSEQFLLWILERFED